MNSGDSASCLTIRSKREDRRLQGKSKIRVRQCRLTVQVIGLPFASLVVASIMKSATASVPWGFAKREARLLSWSMTGHLAGNIAFFWLQ